jgi:hypothetical protein
MQRNELELSKINSNIIRLAEFLANIKKEKVVIPAQFTANVDYFLSFQYGIDIDQAELSKLLSKYQENLEATMLKVNQTIDDSNHILNIRILKSILKETTFLISMYHQGEGLLTA